MRMPPTDLSLLETGQSSDLLICFSHLRWNFVYQRPQHLMSRAAVDRAVWFLEEPLFSETAVCPRMQVNPEPCGVTILTPVLSPHLQLAERLAAQRTLLDEQLARHASGNITTWYYTPMALQFSEHIDAQLCIYDCMDELSAFKFAPTELTALEQRLFDRADLVFTGGHSLYEAKRHCHPNCHPFPSSVDVAHFARARHPMSREPLDQEHIPHPRVGFFGVIDERMDTQLVAELAAARPDLQFIIIGPIVKIDPAALPSVHNLHWLGQKTYAALPEYLSGWDCAFMPFAINEATRFISPTKTPEFLAAGVPVCSTPIDDVVTPYGAQRLVQIASDAQAFSRCLDEALHTRGAEWLARVDRFLAHVSWDETWARMQRLIEASAREAPCAHRVSKRPLATAPARGAYV